eukprot:COSAG05_NODE_3696_length_1898_cov_2.775987_3_plen_26_part_01
MTDTRCEASTAAAAAAAAAVEWQMNG